MTHDPLCEWTTHCIHGENQQHSRDSETLAVPDATNCWMCGADCTCDLIANVREDMLAKCIAAVQGALIVAHNGRVDECSWNLAIKTATEYLRVLQEPA